MCTQYKIERFAMLPTLGNKCIECRANLFKLRNGIGKVCIDADGSQQAFIVRRWSCR